MTHNFECTSHTETEATVLSLRAAVEKFRPTNSVPFEILFMQILYAYILALQDYISFFSQWPAWRLASLFLSI